MTARLVFFVVAILTTPGCFPGPIALDDVQATDSVTSTTTTTDVAIEVDAPTRPGGLAATTDRASEIALTWQPLAGATGYRVYRCLDGCASDDGWDELTVEAIEATSFVDDTIEVPGLPSAPGDIAASSERPNDVLVTWQAGSVPTPIAYRYRVTAIVDGESEPSDEAVGRPAARPVTGYEVQVDDGEWTAATIGSVTSWTDTNAPAPTITAPTITASQGTYAEFVRLSAAGATTIDGAERGYRVRAITAYGAGAESAAASGRRKAGALAYQWERSAGSSNADFAPIAGATDATFDDTTAPANGEVRWYRLGVTAAGAGPVVTSSFPGSRQPLPGIPPGVSATNDRADGVRLTWQPVPDAIGYHVYRDDQRLTGGNGVEGTLFDDVDAEMPTSPWAAPSEIVASIDDVAEVTLSWAMPTRPTGPSASYRVTAVSPAGEGEPSAEAVGGRAAPALVGFEVEADDGQNVRNGETPAVATWTDTDAPPPMIVVEGIDASEGLHRATVELASHGAAAVAGGPVRYRLRAALEDETHGAWSEVAIGHRAVGELRFQWQRSEDSSQSSFADLAGATSASFSDVTMPADGEKRWYRLLLDAEGAEPQTAGPREGWRLAFVEVAGGGSFTCALTSAGRVWCWGVNDLGQLGRGVATVVEPPGPIQHPGDAAPFAKVAAGPRHTCALTIDGDLWCWGSNYSGAIGDGTIGDPALSPRRVIDLGGPATTVSVGVGYTCAVISERARCWGSNSFGKLGDGTLTTRPSPVTVLRSEGMELERVVDVVAGFGHACARYIGDSPLERGTFCWGANSSGQLGDGTTTFSTTAVGSVGLFSKLALGREHTCAIAQLVSLAGIRATSCWGGNADGQLGDGTTQPSTTPVMIEDTVQFDTLALSEYTTCALTSGQVLCWGSGEDGALGNGTSDIDNPTPSMVPGLTQVSALSAGSAHVCVVKSGDVYCWGKNEGALGDGTELDRSVPTAVVVP